MRKLTKKSNLWPVLLCSLVGCASVSTSTDTSSSQSTSSSPSKPGLQSSDHSVAHKKLADLPPAPPREFRGLWVATVANIDWPNKNVLDPSLQKQELLNIMDHAAAANMNVIVLQVRPSCDAFYDSKIEPWSEYLTGKMGRPPSPYYDPLLFAVTEAHKRGLELHAWFNPYRARLRELKSPIASSHVSIRHPELVRTYGKYLWLDPAEPGTQEYSLSVVMDVVRRYDIDGVHFDDYFYPYPEKTPDDKEIDFPDDGPWRRYLDKGGKMLRADWRRENVNKFVKSVYQSIKREKPWVKFGVSPFGIWRPKYPAQITGFDSYEKIYCDARTWLAEGWVDYCAPQLYWPIESKPQSFPVLLQWWAGQNPRHKTMLAGMQVGAWRNTPDETREFERQIRLTKQQAGISGQILWHSRPLFRDGNPEMELLGHILNERGALAPAVGPSFSETIPQPALLGRVEHGFLKLDWQPRGTGTVRQWVVQIERDGHWTTTILPAEKRSETFAQDLAAKLPDEVAVTAVDPYGNLGRCAIYREDSDR